MARRDLPGPGVSDEEWEQFVKDEQRLLGEKEGLVVAETEADEDLDDCPF